MPGIQVMFTGGTSRTTKVDVKRAKRARRPGIEWLEERCVLSGLAAVPANDPELAVRLAPKSDPDGNGNVLQARVAIVGQAAPGALVRLDMDGDGRFERGMRANHRGEFRFQTLLHVGRNVVQVQAKGRDGTIETAKLSATRCDVLIDWNSTALAAVRTGNTNPPLAARNLAMVQLAVFDAVNSIDRRHEPYAGIQVRHAQGASTEAAVARAADEVLTALYPDQAATFHATLAESLATVRNRRARVRGEAVGRQVGKAILALRANDGSNVQVDAPPATKPGEWSPTPPEYGRAVALNFAFVPPFAMTTPSQFRPGPPPALDSATYTEAYNEVESVGSDDSTTRTPDQTAFAHFWADLAGVSFTPPGHWNQIAEDAAMSRQLRLSDEAKLFAQLNVALADAGISCWETKNFYQFWRPVTAIRQGDQDGNPLTVADPNWSPQWETPQFSSYSSGHATFSAAAATILESYFGANTPFNDTGDPTLGLPGRHFDSFARAADEAAASRMYGGIHFRFDNETGLAVGREIGRYVLQNEMK
ncbi:MAG: phosphatase PAP2 family protein [Isosphaeraceae bacterium]